VMPPAPITALFIEKTDTHKIKADTAIRNEPHSAAGRFTAWRRVQSATLINALTIDAPRLRTWHDNLLASVDNDGVVNQAEPLAATALTALALQAWPHDRSTLITIMSMQTWLRSQTDGLVRKDPLTAALVTCALADWDVLPPLLYAQMEIALLDGQAAPWQLWLLPLHTREQQPREFAALRKAADHQVWLGLLKLMDPKNTAVIPISQIEPLTLTTGEHRMAWSYCAWSTADDPERITKTLAAWSQQSPAPVQSLLTTRCGPLSASAVALLAISAPWRLPSIWLPPAQGR